MSSLELMVQHPLYKHVLKFISLSDTREKLLRLLQYFVRFLRYWRFRSTLSPQFANLLPALQSYFTMARKPLRVLKPINHLKNLTVCITDELSDPILRYSEALKQLGFLLFFSLDLIAMLKNLGLLGGKGVNESLAKSKLVKNVNHYGAAMWTLALAGGLLKNVRQLQILLVRYLNERKASEKESVEKEVINKEDFPPTISIKKVQREFFKNILDMTIAANMYNNLGIDNGVIGAFGTVTSIIGLQDLWNSSF